MHKSLSFKLFILSLFSMVNFSCNKDSIMEPDVIMDDDEVLVEGTFTSAAHTTTGKVVIGEVGTSRFLMFSDFKTDSGPDLRVYLSNDKQASEFVDLGKLKATSGDFSYEIPNDADIASMNNVLIWCRAFSVLFGSAELQ